MLDLLIISGLYPKEYEKEILKNIKNQPQMAANNFQWLLVNGFDYCKDVNLTIMNEMFVGSFPFHYRKCFISQKKFSHNGIENGIDLGFINLCGLKQMLPAFREKTVIQEWANQKNNMKRQNSKAVFIYSMNPRIIRQIKIIKKINRNIVICLSINDLFENMSLNKKNVFRGIWKRIVNKRLLKTIREVDCFMVVTKEIARVLCLPEGSYVVVESLIDEGRTYCNDKKKNNNKTIVYTGGINKEYGIEKLLCSFSQIKDETYRLILCGDGNAVNIIKQYVQKDPRINYKGVVSSEEAREIQRNASVLVNPRENMSFTKYSFAHKTMEYLISGVPVVCYKLDGIPDDYDDHLLYVEDNTTESLKNKLIEICNISQEERDRIRESNISFINTHKLYYQQTMRIVELINKQYY